MPTSNKRNRATHFSGLLVSPSTVSASAATLDKDLDSNKTIILSIAGAQTITLPTATGSGAVYKIVVGVTATGNKVIQVGNATDEFAGVIYQVDTDTADALVAYPAVAADNYDTITLNGTTTGGLQGDVVILTDIASGVYLMEGDTKGTGVVATPLSAAV